MSRKTAILINLAQLLCALNIWLCALIGGFPLFVGRWILSACRPYPLSDLTNAVADENGRIYVGVQVYGRLEVFDRRGRYLYGFPYEAKGMSRLQIDDQGLLRVASARTEDVIVYNRKGRLVRTDRDGELFDALRQRDGAVDRNGQRYFIRSRLWNPQLRRVEQNGAVSLVIRNPLLLLPYVTPLPWMLNIIVSVAVCRILNRWEKAGGEPRADA